MGEINAMRFFLRNLRFKSFMCGLAIGIIILSFGCVVGWGQNYEAYYNFTHRYPTDSGGAWTNYSEELQGITHDQNNWFISQVWALWKIPVYVDVFSPSPACGVNGVLCADLGPIGGYNHIGDISYFAYGGNGYVLLPLEGGEHPAIAIYNASNLQYVAHANLDISATNTPWVTVDPAGFIYTLSNHAPGVIQKYSLDWGSLVQNGTMSLQKVGDFQILDEAGVLLPITGQGAVFSESGEYLYMNNGYYGDYDSYKDGISVFDMQSKRRIAHSTWDGTKPFLYHYDPTCEFLDWSCEEPEGLTIWDLDDGRAPNISGQLHVLLLDNDDFTDGDDDMFMMHYTNKIFVDKAYTGTERGKPNEPFNTVGEANVLAWDGSEITIKSGYYPEYLYVNKSVKLVSTGGDSVIGQ